MQKKRSFKLSVLLLLCSFVFGLFVYNVDADEPLVASDFLLNGQYSIDTYLTEDNSEHWYKVVIPADGELEIRIMSYCSNSVNYSLHNEDLSEKYEFSSCSDYISGGSETSPVTGTITKVLSKGTYYFCISGGTGRYKILGNHVGYGTNDATAYSYDSPLEYAIGSNIVGALTETDTEDWYRIRVAKSGNYIIKLMSYCSDSLDYTLYNEDLSNNFMNSYISGAGVASPSSYSETIALGTGTFYFKISGAVGKYTMSIQQKVEPKAPKTLKLKVTAKRGKKYFVVKTTKNAKVTAKLGKKKWKNVSSGSKGKVKFKYSKKLKKGNKIKITVKKKGYTTKKKTVKVK